MFTEIDHVEHYRRFGYAVVREVFTAAEIGELARAFDEVHAEALNGRAGTSLENTDLRFSDDPKLGRILRIARWPSFANEVLDRYRVDERVRDILAPLIGSEVRQVVNQLHWKPAGAESTAFGYHQDIGFRRPPEAYRNPRSSYVQTAIAIDPHRPENGAIRVYPESHRLGRLVTEMRGRVMDHPLCDEDLRRVDLDPRRLVDLVLEPGDVALWNLYTVHGSGPNRSRRDRRVYVNGYVKAADCELGEWAFRGGCPHRLVVPAESHA